ncbi:ribosomal RNA-processing protein 8-like isoform X2 [Liolophura sinensis]
MMFEQEDWASNKTADDLSRKLFSKEKRKREEPGETKSAKLCKLDSVEQVQRPKKRKNKGHDEMDADNYKTKTKHQKTSYRGSVISEKHEDMKQDSQPKLKSAKKKKIQALEKSKSPVFKTKSPRNKYKHLAIKKQDKKEVNAVEKTKESKKSLGEAENPPVITKDVMLKRKLKRKKLKSTDVKVSPQKNGKPENAVKQTKRKRKRKKKNNPKKNKYRHLVLLKYGEQGVGEKGVAAEVSEEIQSKPARKSPTSRGQAHSFDVTRLKQALVTSIHKSEDQQEKTTESKPVTTKRLKTERKTEKPEDAEKGVKRGGSTLKEKVTAKLTSARFRFLNEQLYTQTGQESYNLFAEDEEAFLVYHDGFQNQVEKWPSNPLDSIIKYISNKPPSLIVADFGCGDARLAQSIPNKVHSFDLVALNEHVTACDMAKVPLKKRSVDICVFCLSLMGTNLVDYLTEANRILKTGGILKIAEVSSRFDSLPQFIDSLKKLGFSSINQNTPSRMFVLLDFKKVSHPQTTALALSLKPCVYKRR